MQKHAKTASTCSGMKNLRTKSAGNATIIFVLSKLLFPSTPSSWRQKPAGMVMVKIGQLAPQRTLFDVPIRPIRTRPSTTPTQLFPDDHAIHRHGQRRTLFLNEKSPSSGKTSPTATTPCDDVSPASFEPRTRPSRTRFLHV